MLTQKQIDKMKPFVEDEIRTKASGMINTLIESHEHLYPVLEALKRFVGLVEDNTILVGNAGRERLMEVLVAANEAIFNATGK